MYFSNDWLNYSPPPLIPWLLTKLIGKKTPSICRAKTTAGWYGAPFGKYCLVCNTAFLSLFTIKFVQYDKIHSKVRTLKAYKIYRKFPIHIYTTKYTLSWNKNAYKISRKFLIYLVGFFVPTYSVYLSWGVTKNEFFPNGAPLAVWKNIVYFVTLRDKYTVSWNKKAYSKFPTYFANFFVPTYSVFVTKCNKINNIFPNGGWAAPFGKKSFFFNISRQILFKLEQKIYKIIRKFSTWFVSVFYSYSECILLHNALYISETSDIYWKFRT